MTGPIHLLELSAAGHALAPWPGLGALSRSADLEELRPLLCLSQCTLAHAHAPALSALLGERAAVVYTSSPSVSEAVSMMQAGASDYVPHSEAWLACLAASGQDAPGARAARTLSQSAKLDYQRMELIGRLSWGLAHEILNPATFVVANLEEVRACIHDLRPLIAYGTDIALLHGTPERLQRLKREARWPMVLAELEELLDESQQGMGRIRNLLDDLRAFGPDAQAQSDTDMRRVLEQVLGLARHELQGLEQDLDIQRVPPVRASPAHMASLLYNLLGVMLKRRVQPGPRRLTVRCRQLGQRVHITLLDSAQPRGDQEQVNLARPSLGLAFGQQTVTRLGGELSLDQSAHGLRATLCLPAIAPASAPAGTSNLDHTQLSAGARLERARLLVIEADPERAALLSRTLRCRSISVVPEHHQAQAIARLLPPDLVLLSAQGPAPGPSLVLPGPELPLQRIAAALDALDQPSSDLHE